MGEKSKKKAKEPKQEADDIPFLPDVNPKEKKKKSKKPKGDTSALPDAIAPVAAESEELDMSVKGSKKQKSKDGKRKREVADVAVETETPAEDEEDGGVEPPKKKKKDSKLDGDGKLGKKDKKKKSKEKKGTMVGAGHTVADDAAPETHEDVEGGSERKKDKKLKKSKKRAESAESTESQPPELTEEEHKPKKKDKEKRKPGDQDGDVEMADAGTEGTQAEGKKKKDKKAKKDKSQKRKTADTPAETPEKEATAPAPTIAPSADLAERWNVQGLGGGTSRQSKFMRLLGGKKHGVAGTGEAKDGPRKRFDIGQVSQELEKQFDAGIQMKFGTGGQRKGLGA
ncbi:small acidic protein family-domain-containing protein [Chaetomium sp. MPI-CAGE-AT-0009]|nr:small acidic protein family-domain-containing protein [Chaetomium sp. MPI-CAGE-AT-0009]